MDNINFTTYSPKESHIPQYYDLELALFFDGTGNNKNNIEARRADPEAGKTVFNFANSFDSEWSNVARLWDGYDADKRIYIEGIGTEDNKSDSVYGSAFGSGATGIRAKVRKGCVELVKKMRPLLTAKENAGEQLRTLFINVYGFSRGAAAARNFVNEVGKSPYKGYPQSQGDGDNSYVDDDGQLAVEEMPAAGHLGYSLQQANIAVDSFRIRVNMLGIFDTVSSYSLLPIPQFGNDVAELGLHNLGMADHIVHFTATDEFRKNFALTRVTRGVEKEFPGVHSDIGGSYKSGPETRNAIETAWFSRTRLEALRAQLICEGWYTDSDLKITGSPLYWMLRGEKLLVHKEYSYIPLHFMADYSVDYKAAVKAELLVYKYPLNDHPQLQQAKERLQSYVRNDAPHPFRKELADEGSIDLLHALRYSYLHRSAQRLSLGMGPSAHWERKEY